MIKVHYNMGLCLQKSATFESTDMATMSSFKFIFVSLIVILLNENLFCNGEPGLYLRPYKGPACKCRYKRESPMYSHQQPGNYQVPHGTYPIVRPLNTYQPVQQPMAYQLQPIQQGFYAQPAVSSIGFHQPQTTARFVLPQQQIQYIQRKLTHQDKYTQPAQQVQYAQPAQQIQYTQPSQQVQYAQPAQQVQYIQPPQQLQYTQPNQQVAYVQPVTSDTVKPRKPEKVMIKGQNGPQVQLKPNQIITSHAQSQPVKYTIPVASVLQQTLPQTYYSGSPTSYPQIYSIPQSTYIQGQVIPETSYPQGYPIPETSYPQGYPIPETSYPQGYPIPETSYPQGQEYPVPQISYPQGYPVPEISYPQDNPVNNVYTEIIKGANYVDTSPEYLLQGSVSAIYPYGNPNVRIYPKKYINGEVFAMPNKVDTPSGKIDVELIDVMPYKPGTEPIRKVPRVNSIEAIIDPKNTLEEDIETNENNSIESTTTTRSSLSIFG